MILAFIFLVYSHPSKNPNHPYNIFILGSTPPNNATLEDYASWAYGIGVSKRQIVQASSNRRTGYTDLTQRAHAYGLRVHPYTLRNENSRLLWDYEQDAYLEFQDYLGAGVDGLFTDFPGSYNKFLDAVYKDTK